MTLHIPKPNTVLTAYKPIAVSSIFCKLVEYVLKNRLDWFLLFLEKNHLLPNNIFGFQRNIGAMECL